MQFPANTKTQTRGQRGLLNISCFAFDFFDSVVYFCSFIRICNNFPDILRCGTEDQFLEEKSGRSDGWNAKQFIHFLNFHLCPLPCLFLCPFVAAFLRSKSKRTVPLSCRHFWNHNHPSSRAVQLDISSFWNLHFDVSAARNISQYQPVQTILRSFLFVGLLF